MKAKWIAFALCVGLAAILAIPVTQADGGDWRPRDSIVGTWKVSIIDVDTEDLSHWLMSWHDDNTLRFTGNAINGPTGGGVWKRIHRRDRGDDDDDNRGASYSVTNGWFFGEDPDGFALYQLRSRNTLHVEGDTLHGTGILDVLSPDGRTVVVEAYARYAWDGVRMKVIPED